MKIKSKIFLTIFMITILITNISYAANITTQRLEASIQKLFSKNITIVTNTTSTDGTSTSTRKITASNVTLANSQIQITEATTGKSFYISYKIEGDVCKFESTLDLSQVDDLEIDPTVLQAMLPIYQATYLELCYLTVADASGVDLSLADTYYYQKTNGQTGTVQNDVFTYKQSTNNNISNISLDVNLAQLTQLNSSKVNSSPSCTVTVEGLITETPTTPTTPEEKPSIDTTKPEEKPSTENPKQEQSSNSTNKNQTTTDIPKAGLETDIIVAMLVLVAIVIFLYIKNKENKDII